MNRRSIRSSFWLGSALLASFSLAGAQDVEIRVAPQEVREAPAKTDGVPILKDIPVLSHLFRRNDETLSYPLDEADRETKLDATSGDLGPSKAPFEDRWLLKAVTSRFPNVSRAELVESITVRTDGTDRIARSHRSIEVRGPAEELSRVRTFLDGWTAQRRSQVEFEVRIVDVGQEAREGRGPTAEVSSATRAEFERRRSYLQSRGAGNLLCAPSVLVWNTQRASLSVSDQVAYVKDFEVSTVQGAMIADPVIDIVQDGIFVDLTPVIDPQTHLIEVEAQVKLATLTRPMRDHVLEIAGHPVTIQLPELRFSKWGPETVEVERGKDGFLLTGLNYTDPQTKEISNVEVWCFVKARDAQPGSVPEGEVVATDDANGNLFVRWPREVVSEDPWEKAPKGITIWRGGTKVGEGILNGGWTMPPRDGDATFSAIAVYRISQGQGAKGDRVR